MQLQNQRSIILHLNFKIVPFVTRIRKMSRLKIALAAAALFLSIGCIAQVHPGNYAYQVDSEHIPLKMTKSGSPVNSKHEAVKISGREIRELSSPYFGVIDFTIENKTADWLDLKDISIEFSNEKINKGVQIPLGNKIRFWAESTLARNKVRDHNRALFAIALTGAGAAIAGSSDSQYMQGLGAAAMIGGYSYLVVNDIGNYMDEIHNSKAVPPNFLIGNDLQIPPSLFSRYWVLFYTPKPEDLPYIEKVYVDLTVQEAKRKYCLEFRKMGVSSEWIQSRGKK